MNKLALQLGLKATLAVLIAVGLSQWFSSNLNHNYWAPMTVLLLMGQSWGDNISKAWARLAMTVVGCCLATLLVWLLKPWPWLFLVIGLIGLFEALFFMLSSYMKSMFWLGMTVVVLLAYLGQWSVHLLEVRIYETLLGAVVVVLVGRLLWPNFAKDQLRDTVLDMLDSMQYCIGQSLNQLQPTTEKLDQSHFKGMIKQLNHYRQAVKYHYQITRYEILFNRQHLQKANSLIQTLDIVFHYLNCLVDAVQQPHFSEPMADIWTSLDHHLQRRCQSIKALKQLQETDIDPLWLDTWQDEVRARIKQLRQDYPHEQQAILSALACLYFSRRIDEVLYDFLKTI